MPLTYAKLANVTDDISADVTTQAIVLAAIAAGEMKVVNIKGRILTSTELERSLDGSVNGEALAAFNGTDLER